MIYITSDCHFEVDYICEFCKKNNLTENDTIIILGDSCLNYYENKSDFKLKRSLFNTGVKFLIINGNHDIKPVNINSYKLVDWMSGKVYIEDRFPSLMFAKDGSIFNIEEMSFLVIGGAYSVDKYYRVGNGLMWMSDEQPSEDDFLFAYENLNKNNNKVDFILTHTVPYSYIPFKIRSTEISEDTIDFSTEKIFDKIYNFYCFKKWFAGHFHTSYEKDKLRIIDKREIISISEYNNT